MTEKLIYKQVRSHSNSNDWNPQAGSGTENLSFLVPPNGDPFTRYSVELLTLPGVTGCEVVSAPRPGTTGQQQLRVKWYYAPFNKVTYRVRAYTGKPGPIEIVVDSSDWLNRVKDAIAQNLAVRLVVRGIQARDLYRQLLLLSPNDVYVPANLFYEPDTIDNVMEVEQQHDGEVPAVPVAEVATVTITLAVLAGLVVIAGFATIAGVLMMAMHKDYSIPNIHYKTSTVLGDIEFTISLFPPNR